MSDNDDLKSNSRESHLLTRKLTHEERADILGTLFGFVFDNDGSLLDDEGNLFYMVPGNDRFDFSNLINIFSYTAHRAKNQGYEDAKFNIRRILGL